MENKEYKILYVNTNNGLSDLQSFEVDGTKTFYRNNKAVDELLNKHAAEGWAPISISFDSSRYICYILLERVCPPPKDTIS